MAGNKYIRNNAGTLTEEAAIQVSTGAADAGKIPALDSTGHLDISMMPVGIGADTVSITASENLAAGDYVNIWNDTGMAKVRKADATTAGKEAHGFVLEAVTANTLATVYFEGTNTQLSGLTAGIVFLSTTPGQVSSTPPSSPGNIVQRLGVAVSETAVSTEIQQPIVLA